jgi:hypothetical protein
VRDPSSDHNPRNPKRYHLSDEDKGKVDAWIKERWQSQSCPRCGQPEWWIVPELLIHEFYWSQPMLYPGGHPFVQLICQHCGHLEQMEASLLGIVPPGHV